MTFGSELTGREIAIVDANSAAMGVKQKQLMESAGNAATRVIRAVAGPDDQIEIVAGTGNNGGDALVAARFLGEYDCRVTLLGDPDGIGTTIARENWGALTRSTVETRTVSDSTAFDLDDPAVIVDAMLGTGIAGALREPVATAAEAINAADSTVVSLDVPSGLDATVGTLAEGAVQPDRVVTFHKPKPGLDDLDAPVEVADIGVPPGAEFFVERGDLLRLDRPAESHKGDYGEVLVIGGGPYTGAPALAAQSALRAGTDLVRVAVPAAIAENVAGYSENLIVRPFDGTQLTPPAVDPLLDLAADHDSVVLGPGLGDGEATLSAVKSFLEGFDGTAIVDADALRVVPDVETTATLVCTPHRGEFERMGGRDANDWEDRADNVADLAAELGVTLLVKGPVDVISDGDRTRASRTGNPGMTVGGTGDVLAGVTGALATTLDPHPAASVGAYVTGRAGDLAVAEQGYGLVATDVLDRVPTAIWKHDEE
ncbi:MAG: NAD(P)H-hydrate dehydratase [Halorhabdus sp.]